MHVCKYMEENGSAAMLATKRLAGVAPNWSLIVRTEFLALLGLYCAYTVAATLYYFRFDL